MSPSRGPLARFHPLVARWFAGRYGAPTPLQEAAWPVVGRGEHALLVAPTGSGKTLAAFLWALDRLVAGAWPAGATRVLYVSPLRALNHDVQRNLLAPLEELARHFAAEGLPFTAPRVLTRSGDTPEEERRRMLRRPPEILITTPESLNLLLLSPAGRAALGGLRTVILDEIHAVAGSKRGVHLVTAVERLVPLAGEFQRLALSATVRPLEEVAAFVGGQRIEGGPGEPRHVPRRVRVVRAGERKRYLLAVRYPPRGAQAREAFWSPFVEELRAVIARNRATLVFVNSRRLCEKIAHLLNQGEERPLAWAHHGSLSRELRAEVERRLKAGELRAIVATGSLELGIDIGALDEVVLLQSPSTVSAAVQRIGRAGHGVGQTSRGTFLPTHPLDLAEAAVLAEAVPAHAIEAVRPVEAPLDVLAQVLVGMTLEGEAPADELFRRVRASHPYRALPRAQFDLVLEMLAGRYAGTRLRELAPRLRLDRAEGTVAPAPGSRLLLALSGGTIPDRGYFHLRHHESGARVGELDEEFVWEARVGQTFTFGAQNWRIERITHHDVFARPAEPRAIAPPFWRAEEQLRDFHLSERIGLFLERADPRVGDPSLAAEFSRERGLDPQAAARLVEFLAEQKRLTRAPLPHRRHLLAEACASGPGGHPGRQLILHTLWGGRVNRPFALALEAAWEEAYGELPEVYAGNDCLLIVLARPVPAAEVLRLVRPESLLRLLRARLEGSGFFGARFREAAGRALMLPRRRPGERQPLWLNRLRSQRLLEAARQHEDFPLLLEAWRTCLRDEFEIEALGRLLGELEAGEIAWSEAPTAAPSPFARGTTWQQINQYMYADDTPAAVRPSRLRDDLVREAAARPELRPLVAPALVRRFEQKRQRLAPGYAPASPRETLEWVKERVLLPESEWQALLAAAGPAGSPLGSPHAAKLAWVAPESAAERLLAPRESLARLLAAFWPGESPPGITALDTGCPLATPAPRASRGGERGEEDLTGVLAEWLRFYGPRPPDWIRSTLGVQEKRIAGALGDLADAGGVVGGRLVEGEEGALVCDRENLESLLRLRRAAARPVLSPLPLAQLPLFLAHHQGLTAPARDEEAVLERLAPLVCFPAPAAAWEEEILPARAERHLPARLDALLGQGGVGWTGCGERRALFCFEQDWDLLGGAAATGAPGLEALFPDPRARYDFSTLLRASGLRPAELSARLWAGVWAGRATNDLFAALRRGIETGFRPPEGPAATPGRAVRPGRRAAFERWRSSLPWAGSWRLLSPPELDGEDPLQAEERRRERVRVLLERYGILFRELTAHELPPFRWGSLFRTLRLMELAGEVTSGHFFEGVHGPQFVAAEGLRMLREGAPADAPYWLAATDPASVCGLDVAGLRGALPRRVAGTFLSWRGTRLLLSARRLGRAIETPLDAGDPLLPMACAPLAMLLTREFRPLAQVVVETINGLPAARSPFLGALRERFDVLLDLRRVILRPR